MSPLWKKTARCPAAFLELILKTDYELKVLYRSAVACFKLQHTELAASRTSIN